MTALLIINIFLAGAIASYILAGFIAPANPSAGQFLFIAGGIFICLLGLLGFAYLVWRVCSLSSSRSTDSIRAKDPRVRTPSPAKLASSDQFDKLAASLARVSDKAAAPEDSPAPVEPECVGEEQILPRVADGEDVQYKLRIRAREISALIGKSQQHLAAIDDYMIKHLNKNTSGSIQAVIDIRRIVTALEKRLSEIDAVLRETAFDRDYALFLLNGELIIDEDSLSKLISQQPIAPLKPSEWSAELGRLFAHVSRRRSLFKALKFTSAKEK